MHHLQSHSVLARYFHENRHSLNIICSYCISSQYYIPGMALLAAVLKINDVKRIMDAGPILPKEMRRARLTPGKIISLERERDIFLITSVIYLLVNLLLMFSVLLDIPAILCPWMLFQTFMIVAELAIFIIKLLKSETVCLNKTTLLSGAFALYNWLQVFCHLRKYFILCR